MSRSLLLAMLLTTTPAPDDPARQPVDRLFRSMYGPSSDVQVTYGAVPAARPSYGPLFGFESAQTVRDTGFYREGNPNFSLNANLVQRAGVTELDLQVGVVPAQVTASFKRVPTQVPRSSLPLLRVFPGAAIKGTYPATSPNGAMSSAHVRTDRSANEVFHFSSAQLGAAGWKARTDTADGPLRVVTYSLRDLNGREALGTLGIRPWEGEGGGYVLTVSVQDFKPW